MSTIDTSPDQNPADDLDAPAQAIVVAADKEIAAAISTLGLIQQARLANQRRAATLAVATFGKESPQAIKALQAVAATAAASGRLTVLGHQADTPAPTVSAKGWVLHGRVYASDLTPQPSHTVFLVDEQKNYLRNYGFAYTDASGYFLLSSDRGSTAMAAAGDEAQPAAPEPDRTASGSPSSSKLFLQVVDASANPVLLSETAFVPVVGKATYQAVTLPAGAPKLGDPPAELRAVALPPTESEAKPSPPPPPGKPGSGKGKKS